MRALAAWRRASERGTAGGEREVAAPPLGDGRAADGPAPRLRGRELRPRALGAAAELAPEIDLPRGAKHEPVRVGLDGIRRQRNAARLVREVSARTFRLDARVGRLARPRDAPLRARLLDALGGG